MSSMNDVRNINFFRLFIISWIILFISLFQLGAIAGGTPLTIQNFNYGEWGSYYTTSYGSEMYFAGYVGGGQITYRDIFTYNATSNSGQLHRVLINDNIQRTINVNDTFTLNEGYILKIKDFNMGAGSAQVWLSLLKGGNEVFDDIKNEGETFTYAPSKTGSVNDLPIIAVHASNISNVSKTVTIDGVFEISEDFIKVGENWKDQFTFPSTLVDTISYLGNGIAVASNGISGHIFRSTDYGSTWSDEGVVAGTNILSSAFLGNGIVIFGTNNGHIWRSTNFGVTWTDLGTAATGSLLTSTYLENNIAIIGSSNKHIYRSIDSGVSWSDLGVIATGYIKSSSYIENGIVVAGDLNGHVFRSTDFGATWTDLGAQGINTIQTFSYLGNGIIIFGNSIGKIFRSNDFGITWTDLGVKGSSMEASSYLENGVVVIGDTGGHVFKSKDYGLTYTDLGAVITQTQSSAYLGNGIVIFGSAFGHIFRGIVEMTPTPTPTVTPTPTPTVTPTPTPTVTITPTDVENNKVAILQVGYNIGRKDNGAEVTVTLKNVGSSTARFVNLSMIIPTELGAVLDSGAEMDGNTMVWKGDIETGKEHVIKYHVGPVKADIEIPVRVTYINSEKTLNKVMAKASAEGMSASSIPIDPQDLQTILLIIQIAKSLAPGFEIVLAMVGIGVVYAIRKINR